MANLYDLSSSAQTELARHVMELHTAAQKVDTAVTYELEQLDKCLALARECSRIVSDTVKYLEALCCSPTASQVEAFVARQIPSDVDPAHIMYLGDCAEGDCPHWSWAGDSYSDSNTECFCKVNGARVYRKDAEDAQILCPLGKLRDQD